MISQFPVFLHSGPGKILIILSQINPGRFCFAGLDQFKYFFFNIRQLRKNLIFELLNSLVNDRPCDSVPNRGKAVGPAEIPAGGINAVLLLSADLKTG